MVDVKEEPTYGLLHRQWGYYLGTRGVRFKDAWLFGTARGVIAYHEGRWLALDGLNARLPAHWLHRRGAQVVRTIAVDAARRIIVGTHLGLAVIDPGDMDTEAFITRYSSARARSGITEVEALAKETAILSPALASAPATKTKSLFKLQSEVDALTARLPRGARLPTSQQRPADKAEEEARAQLKTKEGELDKALEEAKTSAPFEALMIRPDPASVVAIQSGLREGEVYVRHAFDATTLHIEVISKQRVVERTVETHPIELVRRAELLARRLGQGETSSLRSSVLSKLGGAAPREREMDALYDVFFRPIESDLKTATRVYVQSDRGLLSFPWSALTRRSALKDAGIVNATSGAVFLASRESVVRGEGDLVIIGPGTEPRSAPSGVSLVRATAASLRATVSKARFLEIDGGVFAQDAGKSGAAGAGLASVADLAGLDLPKGVVVVLTGWSRGLGEDGLDVRVVVRALMTRGAAAVVIAPRVDGRVAESLQRFYGAILAKKSVADASLTFDSTAEQPRGYVLFGG